MSAIIEVNVAKEKKGAAFIIRTQKSEYAVVVLDPKKCEIAMDTTNKQVARVDVWELVGASRNRGMVEGSKEGFIVVGMHMMMCKLSGEMSVETTAVHSISPMNDAAEAERIMREAEANTL